MASAISYGEVIYETSRAFADDEDEDFDPDSGPAFEVSLQKTEAGEEFLAQTGTDSAGILCIFNGKVAVGFGQGFLQSKDPNFVILGQIEFIGKEGTVDSLMERPRKKIVAKILRIKSKSNQIILFALIDSYGVPRSFANEIQEQLQVFLGAVKQVVIFHNEPLALFLGGQEFADGKLFYIKNNSYKSGWITKFAKLLPQPNLVAGISAAVLSHCEMIDKPALLLVNYSESDLVDSISVKPFVDGLKPENFEGAPKEENLAKYFSENLQEFKITLASHVSQSNLYI